MKYADSIAKYSIIRSASIRENRKKTGKRTASAKAKWQGFVHLSQQVLRNITLILFTTTLFLGGSYLFFVQLAEYGW